MSLKQGVQSWWPELKFRLGFKWHTLWSNLLCFPGYRLKDLLFFFVFASKIRLEGVFTAARRWRSIFSAESTNLGIAFFAHKELLKGKSHRSCVFSKDLAVEPPSPKRGTANKKGGFIRPTPWEKVWETQVVSRTWCQNVPNKSNKGSTKGWNKHK